MLLAQGKAIGKYLILAQAYWKETRDVCMCMGMYINAYTHMHK